MIEIYKHDMKKTWQTLKKVLGKQNNKSDIPQTFIINNENISNRPQIAQAFNNFFSSIGKLTSQNVPTSKKTFYRLST